MKRYLISTLTLGLLFASGAHGSKNRRIVAIGDIHGAHDALHSILQRADLIDAEGRWIGGDSVLVQTGDILDRGPEAFQAIELLMSLQSQAAQMGGEVLVLLGNHEAMNLLGELKDVARHNLHALVGPKTEARCKALCDRYAGKRAKKHARCMESIPPGLMEYTLALGPQGEIGRWLRDLPTVAAVGDVIFLHGGLAPAMADWSIEEINERVHREVAFLDAAREWLLDRGHLLPNAGIRELAHTVRPLLGPAARTPAETAELPVKPSFPKDLRHILGLNRWFLVRKDGPLWFRDYTKWEEPEGIRLLGKILGARGAERIVVGHTPVRSARIRSRFEDQLFLIDTGMLEIYQGRASALEIIGDRVRALYLDGEQTLVGPEPDPLPATALAAAGAGAGS